MTPGLPQRERLGRASGDDFWPFKKERAMEGQAVMTPWPISKGMARAR